MKYKVASALSFLISANVYAGDDAWEVDARYSYYHSTSSSGLIRQSLGSSLNFTLNDSLDEDTTVYGVFTLDNPISETVIQTKTDKVRQLYLTHELENGTQVKLGKRAGSFDRTKGIQELGVYCDTSLDIICTGAQSLSINTPLDKNTELQVLASKSRYSFIDRNEYTARVKRSISDADYYLKLGYNDGPLISPNFNHYSLGLSVELPDKENPKDKWYADYEHTEYNNTPSYLPEAVCDNYYRTWSSATYLKINKLDHLNFGRVASINKLLINANVGYLKELRDSISDRTYCEGEVPMRSSISTGYFHQTKKTAALTLEYPIPNGKIVSKNSYTNSWGVSEGTGISKEVIAMYDLNSSLSTKLGYRKLDFSGSRNSHFDTTYIDFKYKF